MKQLMRQSNIRSGKRQSNCFMKQAFGTPKKEFVQNARKKNSPQKLENSVMIANRQHHYQNSYVLQRNHKRMLNDDIQVKLGFSI